MGIRMFPFLAITLAIMGGLFIFKSVSEASQCGYDLIEDVLAEKTPMGAKPDLKAGEGIYSGRCYFKQDACTANPSVLVIGKTHGPLAPEEKWLISQGTVAETKVPNYFDIYTNSVDKIVDQAIKAASPATLELGAACDTLYCQSHYHWEGNGGGLLFQSTKSQFFYVVGSNSYSGVNWHCYYFKKISPSPK